MNNQLSVDVVTTTYLLIYLDGQTGLSAAVLNEPNRPAPAKLQLLNLHTEYGHVHIITMRRAEAAGERVVRIPVAYAESWRVRPALGLADAADARAVWRGYAGLRAARSVRCTSAVSH